MVVGEGLPGGADGVQGVALSAGPSREPLGSADLDHLLAMGLQEGRQAGAVAASAFHRPTAPTGHLRSGEVEQATVAGPVGADRHLGEQAPHRVGGSGGQGVSVGVDADDAVNGASQPGHCDSSSVLWATVGLEDTARQICDGSQPEGWTGCSSGQQRWSGRRRHHGRQLVTKAT